MKDSVVERIRLVKEAGDDYELLKKHLCPFYEKGSHPDCVGCSKTEAQLDECKEVYLEQITMRPMDIWTEEFEVFSVEKRDKVPIGEISGIGINCNSCYMYDKCPMYKKGYECGIEWDSGRPKNPAEFMDFLVEVQYERVNRARVFEKIDGGVPDANLSAEIDRLENFVMNKVEMGRERLSMKIEASGPATSGGGILSKIFGAKSDTPELPEKTESSKDIIDIPSEIVKPESIRVPRKRKSHGTD